MNEDKIMSAEAFNELIDGFEIVGSLTEYGRRNVKYHVKKLQEENQQLKEQLNKKYENVGTLTSEILYEENTKLVQENQQLKKQYCERTDCSGRIGNSKKVEELEKRLEASERARKEAIEHIKELYDNTDDTTCYDIDKVEKERLLQILDIDKGE